MTPWRSWSVGRLLGVAHRRDELFRLAPAGGDETGQQALADLAGTEDGDSPSVDRHARESTRPARAAAPARRRGRRAGRPTRGPATPRREQGAQRSRHRRRGGPTERRRASRGRGRRRGRARSGPVPRARRRLPTRGRGRPRGRSAGRSPPWRRDASARARRSDRHGRGRSRGASRAPSERRRAGESAPSSALVGAAWRPVAGSRGAIARMTRRSICRASRAVISWPQTARRSDWATVPTRSGRSPRRRGSTGPSSGSSRKRAQNSEWSSSSASWKRTAATAASLSARTTDRPVGALPGDCALERAVDAQHRLVAAVEEAPRRVAAHARAAREGERAAGSELGGQRHRSDGTAVDLSASDSGCGRLHREVGSPLERGERFLLAACGTKRRGVGATDTRRVAQPAVGDVKVDRLFETA